MLCSSVIFGQNIKISGYIKDSLSNEVLINANIYTSDYKNATSTDNYGYFSISLPKNTSEINISYVGYNNLRLALNKIKYGQIINIPLSKNTLLQDVNVNAVSLKNEIKLHKLGTNEISISKVENLPCILGEPDILRVLQNMPGIQSGNTGTSGLFVRGTDPGQSLVLLDGVPLYNINHLYGFYSVFNSDAINSATLYKGGFPARYGGRSSAIMDVTMREGSNNKIGVKGSIGIVASRILVEGPVLKDKITFLVSARRTYLDLFTNTVAKQNNKKRSNQELTGYNFYDATAKINYNINAQNRLFASFYGGSDFLYNTSKNNTSLNITDFKSNLKWGNRIANLRYVHTTKNGIYINTQLYSSQYFYNQVSEDISLLTIENQYEKLWKDNFNSKIRDVGIKTKLSKSYKKHNFEAGMGLINHRFQPSDGEITRYGLNTEPYDTIFSQGLYKLTDYNLYFEDNIEIHSKLKSTIGLRLVAHDIKNIEFHYEPRIQLQYLASDWLSFKAAYVRVTQNSFLISTNTMVSPADLWVFKTKNMKPLISDQVDFGISAVILNEFKLSFESYYKILQNVPGIAEGVKIDRLDNWEKHILQGKGKAYGFEFLAERRSGKVNGWVSYTLGYSKRQFNDINMNHWYRFKYDRRHNISIVSNVELSKRLKMNLVWNFASGNLISIYTNQYLTSISMYNNNLSTSNQIYASEKNNHELPPYHQLDIGFTFTKKKKRATVQWNYGIYNVYNQFNPFYIANEDGKYKLYNSLPILPYISYNFAF